jgi:hypothetical protein
MPSTSKKQHNFMEMVAHNPKMAKKVGVPQSVGKDFAAADKGKKFAGGGGLNADINKQKAHHTDGGVPYQNIKKFAGLKGGGMAKDMESKKEMREEEAMDKKQDVAMIKKAFKEHDAQEHKGGKGTKITLKAGGKVRGCGIAQKGLTKGKVC